jgi:hypothetical protein
VFDDLVQKNQDFASNVEVLQSVLRQYVAQIQQLREELAGDDPTPSQAEQALRLKRGTEYMQRIGEALNATYHTASLFFWNLSRLIDTTGPMSDISHRLRTHKDVEERRVFEWLWNLGAHYSAGFAIDPPVSPRPMSRADSEL